MLRPRTIVFCQQWPDSHRQDGNTYWIGLSPIIVIGVRLLNISEGSGAILR
jgi:hypothetical protein